VVPDGRFPRNPELRRFHRSVPRVHLVLGAGVSAVQGLLLGVSILVFIYLGIAMFKPEWF
jgi:hypothetical protein